MNKTIMHRTLRHCHNRGINLDVIELKKLIRISSTLSRWNELECGNSNMNGNWHIERDDTGVPYFVAMLYGDKEHKVYKTRIPDREKGALRRLDALAKEKGFFFYRQPDPRGISLYVNNEPINDINYSNGIAIGK